MTHFIRTYTVLLSLLSYVVEREKKRWFVFVSEKKISVKFT